LYDCSLMVLDDSGIGVMGVVYMYCLWMVEE
jgi:hypothetical protein